MRAPTVYKRKGREGWTVDWRDDEGRHQPTFTTRKDANAEVERVMLARRADRGLVEDVPLSDYAARWLVAITPGLKQNTVDSYRWAMAGHVLPELGHLTVRQVTRSKVKDLVVLKLRTLSKKSVSIMKATLHACLNEAIEDGIVVANAAAQRGKSKTLRLAPTRAERQQNIKAMDVGQLAAFLSTCRARTPHRYRMFFLMTLTGVRIGEAFGLKVGDIDLEGRHVNVRRGITDGRVETTKGGRTRVIDMAEDLRVELVEVTAGRAPGDWLFPSQADTPLDQAHVGRSFKKTVLAAGLPDHFTPHCLRHTFASQLLLQGESIYYVKEQLGHSSIQLTVDLYGSWLPAGNPACVNRWAERVRAAGGDRTVTGADAAPSGNASKLLSSSGAPGGI